MMLHAVVDAGFPTPPSCIEFVWQKFSARGFLTHEDVMFTYSYPCWQFHSKATIEARLKAYERTSY